MTKWIEIANLNLIANSVCKSDFEEAINEWYISEKIIDNYLRYTSNSILPSCELCEHEKLRWQFEIKNKNNGTKLLVGSTCITKFDIPLGFDKINFFHGDIRDKLLIKKINTIKNKYIQDHLNQLLHEIASSSIEDKEEIIEIYQYWEKSGSFTPKMAYVFVSKCLLNKININEINLSITLRKIDDRIEILHLSEDEYNLIYPYLEKTQMSKCNKIRNVLITKET